MQILSIVTHIYIFEIIHALSTILLRINFPCTRWTRKLYHYQVGRSPSFSEFQTCSFICSQIVMSFKLVLVIQEIGWNQFLVNVNVYNGWMADSPVERLQVSLLWRRISFPQNGITWKYICYSIPCDRIFELQTGDIIYF